MTNQISNPGLAVSNALADAVQRAAGYTVLVDARKRMPLSGVVYADGLVLTASHGVEREEGIRVGLPDGREVEAALAGRDHGSDLALLRVSGADLQPAPAASQEARVGHLVLAVGRPASSGVQASLGLVNALGEGLRGPHGRMLERYIAADATPYPGFSGGPLVDLAGDVLGINTSGLVQGMSLSIPLKLAWQVAAHLAEHGHVRRGYFGIRSQPVEIPVQARAALGREQATGLLVVGIEAGGPAAASPAGLMVGDILVGISGRPLTDHDDLLGALTGDLVGRAARVDILRGGQRQTVDVMVGERK
jgi:S1-C subfamily serine protease